MNELVFFLLLNDLALECGADEIGCDDKCHPISIRCDGEEQCSDGFDEEDCGDRERPTTIQPEEPDQQSGYPSSAKPPIQCPEWKCPGEEVCFGVAERCDGRWTCNSGYDESGCQRKKSFISSPFCHEIYICQLQVQKMSNVVPMNLNVTIPFACQMTKNAMVRYICFWIKLLIFFFIFRRFLFTFLQIFQVYGIAVMLLMRRIVLLLVLVSFLYSHYHLLHH